MGAQQQREDELLAKTLSIRDHHGVLLAEWAGVLNAGRNGNAEMQGFADCLEKTKRSLKLERARRGELRSSIRSMMESLAALDAHLEALATEDEEPQRPVQIQV